MTAAATTISRWQLRPLDVYLALGLFVIDLAAATLITMLGPSDAMLPHLRPGTVAAAAIVDGAFAWRARKPLAVFGIAAVGAIVFHRVLPLSAIGLTLALAVYGVGAWSSRRTVLAVATGTVAVLAGAVLLTAGAVPDAVTVPITLGVLPALAGYLMQTRRLYRQSVAAQIEQLERERDTRAREAVLADRNRIARELHDVVAHRVSLMGVQAGAARASLNRAGAPNDETASQALEHIEEASRTAVAEMRQLLGTLSPDGDADLMPQPSLADLDDLIESFAAAGLSAEVVCEGDLGAVGPLLAQSAYRIVQESLTNVSKHSGAGTANVLVRWTAAGIDIEVEDPGPAHNGTGTGRGIAGMRERVTLFGGQLQTGPTSTGGWRVVASLPRPHGPTP